MNPYIETFNHNLKVNVEGSTSRGESKDDLTTNLFKTNQVASGTECFRYIKNKKYIYYDRADINTKHIMIEVLKKYKVLLTSGKWNEISHEQ